MMNFMIKTSLRLLVLLSICSSAQAQQNIQLSEFAPTVDAFVPDTWSVEQRLLGDFNEDGLLDYLLVIVDSSPVGNRALLHISKLAPVEEQAAQYQLHTAAGQVLICQACEALDKPLEITPETSSTTPTKPAQITIRQTLKASSATPSMPQVLSFVWVKTPQRWVLNLQQAGGESVDMERVDYALIKP